MAYEVLNAGGEYLQDAHLQVANLAVQETVMPAEAPAFYGAADVLDVSAFPSAVVSGPQTSTNGKPNRPGSNSGTGTNSKPTK